ncbi:MAG TPA: nuclear transport factor 2 family protein [Candidatus Desulfobacillus sp.]|nr:nuclear transport factor 2 family protein [Candidatus Desulfobacillus sp.]
MIDAKKFVAEVFATVDSKNVEQFVSHLTDGAIFVFGNAEPARGHAQIAEYVGGFLSSLKQTTHVINDVWHVGDAIITRLEVTYRRLDDAERSYPSVTIWKMRDGRISDYRIFIDNSTLFSG